MNEEKVHKIYFGGLGGVYNEEQLNLYLVLEALFNLFD
jgi:hypothetical protein